jgi:uncharacterized protein
VSNHPSFIDRLNWQRLPARSIVFRSEVRETDFLLAYALVYIVMGYITGLIILNYPMPIMHAVKFNQDVTYTFLFKIGLLLLVPCYVYFQQWKYSASDILMGWTLSPGNLVMLVSGFAAGLFLNAGHLNALKEAIPSHPDAPIRLAIAVIMPLFTAGIPEEFFFRGLLQTRLEKRWNRVSAILVSTTLFMAWHLPARYLLSQGVEGKAGDFWSVLMGTGVPVFIVGLFFSLHWSRYRNLPLLIMIHWGIDILPCVSSMFGVTVYFR